MLFVLVLVVLVAPAFGFAVVVLVDFDLVELLLVVVLAGVVDLAGVVAVPCAFANITEAHTTADKRITFFICLLFFEFE